MRPKDFIQNIKKKKWVWIAIVLVLLLIGFILIGLGGSDAAQTGNVWERTTRQMKVTFVRIGESLGVLDEQVEVLDPDAEGADGISDLPLLPPPDLEGAGSDIGGFVTERPQTGRGVFAVNTHLRAGGNLQVSGSSDLADLRVGGMANLSQLSVGGASEMVGMISALGGIRTGGADIDLEGGRIIGLDPVLDITAGENVVIGGTPENPTISVPNIPREQVVTSLNGQRGVLTLNAGTDIGISGLSIANTSTLASVRSRGGCVSCLIDSDIADDLTIVGGTINNTIIGGLTPAEAYFTNVSITPSDVGSTALTVDGSATFTGRVRGERAQVNEEFITLGQVSELFGGVGSTGVASLNSLYGALTLAGTAGQINVMSDGATITLSLPQDISITASPVFAGLDLTGNLSVGGDADILGAVRAAGFESVDASVRASGDEILRSSISVFPYALPAETGSNAFVRVSKNYTGTADSPVYEVPAAITGTTRAHRLMVKYSDSVSTAGGVEWRIYDTTTNTVADSFTTPGLARSNLDEPEIVITGMVNIPTDGWRIELRVPSGRVRVMDIHMLAFDVVD